MCYSKSPSTMKETKLQYDTVTIFCALIAALYIEITPKVHMIRREVHMTLHFFIVDYGRFDYNPFYYLTVRSSYLS